MSDKKELKGILLAIPKNEKLASLHIACVSEGISLTSLFNYVINKELDLDMNTTEVNLKLLLEKKKEVEEKGMLLI
jgi:hypothetical protein